MRKVDPRERFLRSLARQLRWRPLGRRRFLDELGGHLDEAVSELEGSGLSVEAAVQEALVRLGDAETLARAFRSARRRARPRSRRFRSPAWIAVGALSAVTAWAAELPQASGAKATASTPARLKAYAPARRRPGKETDGRVAAGHGPRISPFLARRSGGAH